MADIGLIRDNMKLNNNPDIVLFTAECLFENSLMIFSVILLFPVRKAIKRKNKSVDKTPPSTKDFERFSIHKNKNNKDSEDSKFAQSPFKKARRKSIIRREISRTFLHDCPKSKYSKYSD